MSHYKHTYNTRLSNGNIKRKKYTDDNSDDLNDSDYIDNSDYNSDSDSDYNYDSESDYNYDSDNPDNPDNPDNSDNPDNNISNNKIQYYKFLNKIFPSNYSKYKIKKLKRQRLLTPKNNKNINLLINFNKSKNNFCINKNNFDEDFNNYYLNNKFKDNNLDEDYQDDENDQDEEDDEGDEDNEHDEDELDNKKILKKQAAKILFKILKKKYQKDEDEDEDEEQEDDDDEDDNNKKTKKKCNKSKNIPPKPYISNKNYRKFSKILDDDDKESDYFKKELSIDQQEEYINKLQSLKSLTSIETPYLIHLMNIDIPDTYKACALRKINILRNMGGGFGNSEYYKIKSWVDAFIKIPFNKYNNLPITFADGIEKCHDFMENAKKTLDSVTYGLEDAKIQIMQMIGLWLVNPNAIGSAIAIKGPPGTGKTTLIKDGISKILNRPFSLIALGGCGDSGFLDGHDYTYEGSKYGKIIDILIQAGSMNPVILFDELDKISDNARGNEITGVLTHLTDTTQNSHFSDKYMSEISLDMSKALYIFSYNDESKVNPILKDRMYKIETKGYKTKDKLIIAKNYLLPKIREQAKFEENEIIFDNAILEYIINDFTEKESGVRNLKRCLEIIYTKLNLYRLMKPDINLFENSEGFKLKEKISFPLTLTKSIIDNLINKSKDDIPFGMYN